MKLPKFLFNRLKVHNTSLGNNAAFPPEEDYPFDYKIIKKRFNEVCEGLKYLDTPTTDENELKLLLGKLLKRCKEIEEPIKPYLIKLCENWVSKELSIPDETIILNCELTNEIKPKNAFRLMPEDSDARNFDFEDINDFDNVSKVVMKRRLINALIQGIAYNCNKYSDLDSELSKLNEELPSLYRQISIINDYLLFINEEKITDKKPSQGACVEVFLGGKGQKTEINVQGLIFPYLLQETFRGFFELFASHGLPEDNSKANYIVRQADFLLAEPWDMRFGVGLWNILSEDIKDSKVLPYFFTTLCELPVDEFNDIIKEAFAKTKKGKTYIKELLKEAEHHAEMDRFIDTVKQRNADIAVLNDGYISSDELDDFILNDDYISADELDDYVLEEGDEEENNNDNLIQEIISCSVDDIDFREEEYNIEGIQLNTAMYIMHVLVKGIEIPTELIFFRAEGVEKLNTFQLHINIDESLRRNGIAYKLYQAFINIFGSACSLFKNRASTFYDENGSKVSSDVAIDNLWKKLAQLPNIKVFNVKNKLGNVVGVKAVKL